MGTGALRGEMIEDVICPCSPVIFRRVVLGYSIGKVLVIGRERRSLGICHSF